MINEIKNNPFEPTPIIQEPGRPIEHVDNQVKHHPANNTEKEQPGELPDQIACENRQDYLP